MGSPEKPVDVEMNDVSETQQLNPDIKISASEEKSESTRFTGLTKEELLEISNKPHWVRARWALFFLFWVVWIAMLVGAIVIVINAPRCKPEPKLQWYQDSITYEAEVGEFADTIEEMNKHLPYVAKSLNSKSLVVMGVVSETNPMDVEGQETDFVTLVTSAHEQEIKVIVDLKIDVFSTTSSAFVNADGTDLFVWTENNTTDFGEKYKLVYDDTRKQYYKALQSDDTMACLNFASNRTVAFLSGIMAAWFGRGVDGFQLRDLAEGGADASAIIAGLWNSEQFKDSKNNSALLLYSTDGTQYTSLYPLLIQGNDSNTVRSPVVLNSAVFSHLNQIGAGRKMQETIELWRENRNIGGYALPIDSQFNDYGFTIGLNLLLLTLPGVPIIRSGDEFDLDSRTFKWEENKVEPVVENKTNAVFQEMSAKRVAGIQALQAIRFDSLDSELKFVSADEDGNLLVFCRKWDVKPAVLVVANMSPSNVTAADVNTDCLYDSDGKPIKEAKVVAASSMYEVDQKVNVKSLSVEPGMTVVLM